MEQYKFHLEEIDDAANWFLMQIRGYRVIALYGKMGSGKTTFIKAVCKALGIADTVNSPTFALINEYHTPEQEAVYHFDLYRVENIEEIFDLGYEDYFEQGLLTFIEWAEKMQDYLPDTALHTWLTENNDQSRTLTLKT